MILLNSLSGDYLNVFLAGVFGMILLSILLVSFFVVYQRKLFAQERQRREKEKEHQKNLLVAAVEVQEMERRRIARDLHDEIGSLLSATRLYLRQIKGSNPAEKQETIRDQALSILDDLIKNTRRITHDLLPPALEKFGFKAAAEDLCDRITKSEALQVTFNATTELRPTERGENALYRVLQELLSNTMKHANAKMVSVELFSDQNNISFVYQDDGDGFDLSDAKKGGLGLLNMESRIALVHGTIRPKTAPGEGFLIEISLPCRTRASLATND